jgi:hypothetical protein
MRKEYCRKLSSGQALIEYLLIFSFMVFLSINLVKGLGKTAFKTVGALGYELTEQLTVGVCPNNCFYPSYANSGSQ